MTLKYKLVTYLKIIPRVPLQPWKASELVVAEPVVFAAEEIALEDA